ncbi:Acetylornithine aminotransferase [Bienertia sinuspersici]
MSCTRGRRGSRGGGRGGGRSRGGGRGQITPFVDNHYSPNSDEDGDDEHNEQRQQTNVNLDVSCSRINDNTSMSHGEIRQKQIRIQDNNALIYLETRAKENGGILPKAADVYLRTHSKEEPGKGKQLVGSKAKQVMGEYDKKMAEYKDKGIDKDPNEVYFEAVGGRKKGFPGLGSAGDLYYEKPSSRADKSSNTYTPSLLSQLSARLGQSQQQHESERAEWERQRAEWERERLEVEKERNQKEQAQ